jgi:vancomycin resistance protein VanW
VYYYELKRFIKLQIRYFIDLKNGYHKSFPKKNRSIIDSQDYLPQIRITQPILPSSSKENKLQNLQIAAKNIEKVLIMPNETFSFWHLVGNPNEKKGYKKGRNLVNGVLSESIGGGLCQLSGIIHHLALLSGFPIVERYAHSADIYTESERFTPLGTDATIVYGYKDLRFRQHLPFPVFFHFEIKKEEILGELWSNEAITEQKIEFKRKELEGFIEVETMLNDGIIDFSRYKKNESP